MGDLRRLPVVRDQPRCETCAAACCIGLWVPVSRADVRRLSRGLGVPARTVLERYLSWDGDLPVTRKHEDFKEPVFVMRSSPLGNADFPVCTFLGNDGRCTVYAHRPSTCRGFERGSVPCQRTRVHRDDEQPQGEGRRRRMRIWKRLQRTS